MACHDCRGPPVSNAGPGTVSALERCMEDALAFTGDRVAAIDEIPGDHPGFIMGHCFKAGMLTQAMEVRIIEVRIYDDMLASVEAAEALGGPCE